MGYNAKEMGKMASDWLFVVNDDLGVPPPQRLPMWGGRIRSLILEPGFGISAFGFKVRGTWFSRGSFEVSSHVG
jgi:hypothetical protein